MSESTFTSPRFIVKINGEQRCIAGFDGYAVLTAGLSHVRTPGDPDEPSTLFRNAAARFRVGGLQGRQHAEWLSEDLFVGDCATVEIREGGPVDPSTAIQTRDCRLEAPEDVGGVIERRRKRLAELQSATPHRVAVSVNGKLLCTAGVGSGVLSAMITFTRRDPATKPPDGTELSAADWEDGSADLHVGGLENNVFLTWLQGSFDPGDEAEFKVLGPGPIDPPPGRYEHRWIPHMDQAITSGQRITLRKLVDEDLDFLATMLGDAEVMRYWPQPLDRAGAEKWLRRQQQRYIDDNDCGYWLVVDNETHEPVGQAGVLMNEVEGVRLPTIGFMIHRPYWRCGYGSDAAWMCILHIFDSLDLPIAYTLVRPENEPSMALARKLGMTPVRTVQFEGYEHLLVSRERGET